MLVNFTVKNLLSFKEEQTLSLQTGAYLRKYVNNRFEVKPKNYPEKLRLLKSAIVFGGNGSGKSNLVSGLNALKTLVLREQASINDALLYEPFALDPLTKQSPSVMTIEFINDSVLYRYSLANTAREVVKESLEIYDKTQDDFVYYFKRDGAESSVFPEKYQEYQTQIKSNSLVIHTLESKNDQHATNVVRWFANQLVIFDGSLRNIERLNNEKDKEKVLNFLKLADMNMVDLVPVKDKEEDYSKQEKLAAVLERIIQEKDPTIEIGRVKKSLYSLYSVYNQYDEMNQVVGQERIHYDLESSGTKKLIGLALNILFNPEKKVFVFDEFDDAFHQELSGTLLEAFNAMETNTQFILTSHELHLMDNQLRKDQIYFTDKNYRGASELYALYDFEADPKKGRGDITYYRRYLNGLFGGVPHIDRSEIVQAVKVKE
ncbi:MULTISPECIES: AAA family ATPase [Enterococcus]|uniref:AAA family ATPase n=1 Tax=Enterococcus TaxID=1350 RepID=UPI001883C1A2|nr:ATP-binding protein [Enterococcus faecalis]EHL0041984.1 AAA family ATPase [Enterococcus faecalis]MBE9919736.1 AAA family ATPase [Enterococcus faecalis]MCI0138809.1 AAA family ATPase [Enterococcus faecalis]MDN3181584.1 AAA family ATPase [Enterococcus faecalis]